MQPKRAFAFRTWLFDYFQTPIVTKFGILNKDHCSRIYFDAFNSTYVSLFLFSLAFRSSVKCSQKTCVLLKNCHVGTEASKPPIFGGAGVFAKCMTFLEHRRRSDSNEKKQLVRKESYLGNVSLRRGRQRRVASRRLKAIWRMLSDLMACGALIALDGLWNRAQARFVTSSVVTSPPAPPKTTATHFGATLAALCLRKRGWKLRGSKSAA